MLTTRPIDTLEMRELAPYRTLRRPVEHQKLGIFVAEGSKVVERLLTSPLEVVSCLLTPEWLEHFTPLIKGRRAQPELFIAPKELLSHIVGFHLHQGAMAVGRVPAQASLEHLARTGSGRLLLVACDGITNAENLGVLVRNAAAFNADGLIIGETSSSPYLRRSVRNSMGTVFAMPYLQTGNLGATVLELARHFDVHTLAAHPDAPPLDHQRSPFTSRVCLVFGSEGEGISPDVLAACSGRVSIPMAPGVDSLNVASASAVLLYEARRSVGAPTLSGARRGS